MAYRFAGFELDEQRVELRGPDGTSIKLRPKTFEMLRMFVANPGRILSKQELMEAVWPKVHVSEDGLFQCIREIRAALGDEQRQMIKLISGRGYLFTVDIQSEPVATAAPAESLQPERETSVEALPEIPEPISPPQQSWWRRVPLPRVALAGLALAVCLVVGLAVAVPLSRQTALFERPRPILAVMPVISTSEDGAALATGTTDRLIEGFSRIANIRVATPQAMQGAEPPSQSTAQADFTLQAELQRNQNIWTLRVRMIRVATGEVEAALTASTEADKGASDFQEARLAAGIGDPLARRLNAILERGAPADAIAKAAMEQSASAIDRTTRERFALAREMLRKSLSDAPESVDLQVALASLQLRGIMMSWYDPADREPAVASTRDLLERALRANPNYLPILDGYCRLMTATYQYAEGLIACARTLSFDPWNGGALFNIGVTQIYLGRFEEALANFILADRFDTPQVSRWTWLLGAGWVSLLTERNEEAASWLERSIAITPASGRSDFLLAVAYQRLGRSDDAKEAFARAMKLRPGSTALNVPTSAPDASRAYLEATELVMRTLGELGLPER